MFDRRICERFCAGFQEGIGEGLAWSPAHGLEDGDDTCESVGGCDYQLEHFLITETAKNPLTTPRR
jgi:hypothetical protein